jgi:hypothetical protein
MNKPKVKIEFAIGATMEFETIGEAAEYIHFHTDLEYKSGDRTYPTMLRFWTDDIVAPMCSFYSELIKTITVYDVFRVEVRHRSLHYFGTQKELNHFMSMLGASHNSDIPSGVRYYVNGLEIIIRKEDVTNISWKFNDWEGHF